MGKSQRVKGHNFEREIAKMFLNKGWDSAKRHLEFQYQEAMGFDIDNTEPFVVQCKKSKSAIPMRAIAEIKKPGIHVLISKKDHDKAMATMYLDDWFELACYYVEQYKSKIPPSLR